MIKAGPLQKINPDVEVGEGTVVKRGASIGSGPVILCNVTIGAGAPIGAGAVVTKDVPDGAVVVGNPARVLRTAEAAPEGSTAGNREGSAQCLQR